MPFLFLPWSLRKPVITILCVSFKASIASLCRLEPWKISLTFYLINVLCLLIRSSCLLRHLSVLSCRSFSRAILPSILATLDPCFLSFIGGHILRATSRLVAERMSLTWHGVSGWLGSCGHGSFPRLFEIWWTLWWLLWWWLVGLLGEWVLGWHPNPLFVASRTSTPGLSVTPSPH